MTLPQNVQVYELEGPFFFAVADMLADIFTRFEKTPSSLIIRMRSVPFIDSTAVQALKRFVKQCQSNNVELFLAELTPAVKTILNKADFFTAFPTSNVLEKVDDISRVTQIQAP
jgi:SulP family sulfate permease